MRKMGWDQVLLKKFNNTSHFKLLNQVRTEFSQKRLYKKDAKQEYSNENNLSNTSGN